MMDAKKALVGASLLVACLAAAALLWYAADAVVGIFLAVLFGIFLSGAASWLRRRREMSRRVAVSLVMALSLGVIGGTGATLGLMIADQVGELVDTVPKGVARVRKAVEDNPGLKRVADLIKPKRGEAGGGGGGPGAASAATAAGAAAYKVLHLGVAFFLVLISGIFLAYEPELYTRGLLSLVPRRSRGRAAEVLDELYRTLWQWTLGRLAVMAIVGVSHVGLYWAMGLPSALSLGLITGILTFIPNLGPTLAAVPAVMVALSKDPKLALWVLVAHAFVQTAEGYLVTPIIQQRLVDVPPFVANASLLVFGMTMGSAGLLVAAPAAAAGIVLVRMLYVEPVADRH